MTITDGCVTIMLSWSTLWFLLVKRKMEENMIIVLVLLCNIPNYMCVWVQTLAQDSGRNVFWCNANITLR
jgi:hypothetical protein